MVRFADFKVSLPNYFIFIGYLKTGKGTGI